MGAAQQWSDALKAWSIPEEILSQALESPWIHPVELFQIPEVIEMSPSHLRAIEAMPEGGSILDIGCGGGIAAFATVPPASQVIGVDHQPEMLEMFAENARARNVQSTCIEGFWPDVADQTLSADVVTAHHVVYNVQNIVPFITALNDHARSRVVIEMPTHHPLASMSNLWKHFWNLDRPTEPTHRNLLEVLAEMGIEAHCEISQGQMRSSATLEQTAEFMRIRLCLPPERASEVLNFMKSQPVITTREVATIWWDK